MTLGPAVLPTQSRLNVSPVVPPRAIQIVAKRASDRASLTDGCDRATCRSQTRLSPKGGTRQRP
jgi:hypothetical protein